MPKNTKKTAAADKADEIKAEEEIDLEETDPEPDTPPDEPDAEQQARDEAAIAAAAERQALLDQIETLKAELKKAKEEGPDLAGEEEDPEFWHFFNSEYATERITLPSGDKVQFRGHFASVPKAKTSIYNALKNTQSFRDGKISEYRGKMKPIKVGPTLIEGPLTSAAMQKITQGV